MLAHKKKLRKEHGILKKKYDKVTPIMALDRITNSRHFLMRKDRIPEQMLDLWRKHAESHPMAKRFRPVVDEQDYFYEYKKVLVRASPDDVNTDLIVVSHHAVNDFYQGNTIYFPRYNLNNAFNNRKIRNLEGVVPLERIKEIVDVCSAGLWSLESGERGMGVYIVSETIDFNLPSDMIIKNQWIARNISIVSQLNSIYWRKENA